MARHRSLCKPTILALLLTVALFGTAGCGSVPSSDDTTDVNVSLTTNSQDGEAAGEEAQADDASSDEEAAQAEYARALSADGINTAFIGEKFYDGKIKDQDAALEAVQSVIDRIGGDETTKVELFAERPTETGTTYYVFRQRAGDVLVYGASVKLVVNKDGEAVGLISALMPNIQLEDLAEWSITQEEAEEVVRKRCAEEGADSVEPLAGATEQTVIPLEDESETRRYAWTVYTDNYYSDIDAAYLAHYVSEDGEYLYSIPISEPHNTEALAGDKANFNFDAFEPDTWSGTVTKTDGSQEDVEIPVLRDPETGDVYLGDAKRKILCADYSKFTDDQTLAPCMQDEDGFYNSDVLAYDRYIRIWDLYEGIGWQGPDDEKTPSLLLMNMVDSAGDAVPNAFYRGFAYGWQTFSFDRESGLGGCLDVMGHEFTHCVTGTTMTTNLYMNDYGAINEGMSDILGNLSEIALEGKDGAWIIGEKSAQGASRSMGNPHEHMQPEFAWDTYWGPTASEATAANDCGGVHVNSSLLNIVSYKLDEAGMDPNDQFYYWMNVAMAMTPLTDYPQMADLLPWCMEQAGYPQYVDTVKNIVEQARYAQTGEPGTLPEGAGIIRAKLDDSWDGKSSGLRITYVRDGAEVTDGIIAWTEGSSTESRAVVPANDYRVFAAYFEGDDVSELWVYQSDGWVTVDQVDLESGQMVTVKPGETLDLPVDGLTLQ